MITIDERELQKITKEKQTDTERSKGNRSYSERVRDKWFCCAFKLGFLQLICKAFLIFVSTLELALSITLKQRESRHVAAGCRSLKIWDLLSLDMFHNPSFKMTTSLANIARTTASTSKFIH